MIDTEIKQLIREFVNGNLAEEEEKRLLFWINKSEKNREYFRSIQNNIYTEIIDSPDKKLELKWQNLLNRVETKNRPAKTSVFRIATVAAAFLAGIFLTFLFFQFNTDNSNVVVQNITVPFGAKTNIVLPDGSKVWLNSGSNFSYPSEFGDNRPVTLTGEAFFEVEKDSKPFIVSTEYGDVMVKGTSFNVKAFKDENFETTLISGIVTVTEKNTNKTVTLSPGQQASIFNSHINVLNVDTEYYTSWKNGKLIFNEEYLPKAVKRLERWYNVTIQLDNDPRLSKIWYSGTLEMESFSEVLELLKVTAPIDFNYNEKTRTIRLFYKKE